MGRMSVGEWLRFKWIDTWVFFDTLRWKMNHKLKRKGWGHDNGF